MSARRSPIQSLRALHRVALLAAVLACSISTVAHAYVLEGKSWPTGTTVLMQLNLGSAGRTLQDGNTSWDDAVLPVAGMWDQTIQRVSVSTIVNPLAHARGDLLHQLRFEHDGIRHAL
jgi:hypothetical protein